MNGSREAKFWDKLDRSGGPDACWPWTGFIRSDGYAATRVAGRMRRIHQAAWEYAHGVVPPGLEIDHLCRNRACGNPRHLRATTHLDNVRRAFPARTHCPKGHDYAVTGMRDTASGYQRCRICRNAQSRLRKWNKRSHHGPLIGETNPRAKLSAQQVKEIRASVEAGKELAKRYGVSDVAISYLRRGKTWRSVT